MSEETPEYGSLATQVGGNHYKDYAIQPVEFCQRNQLPFCESNAIKYICRHKDKNGRQDIEKAIHYLQILLEMEYGFPEQKSQEPSDEVEYDINGNAYVEKNGERHYL